MDRTNSSEVRSPAIRAKRDRAPLSVRRGPLPYVVPAVPFRGVTQSAPLLLHRTDLFHLGQTIGNRAVARLLASPVGHSIRQDATGGQLLQRWIDFSKLDGHITFHPDAKANAAPQLATFFREVDAYRSEASQLAKGAHVDPAAVDSLYAQVGRLRSLAVAGAHAWKVAPAALADIVQDTTDQAAQDLINLTGTEDDDLIRDLLAVSMSDVKRAEALVARGMSRAQDPLQFLNFLRAAWKSKGLLLNKVQEFTERTGKFGAGTAALPMPTDDAPYKTWIETRNANHQPLYPSAFPGRGGDMPVPTFGGWFSYIITEISEDADKIKHLKKVLLPIGGGKMQPRPLGPPAQKATLEEMWRDGFKAMPKVDLAEVLESRPLGPAHEKALLAPDEKKSTAPVSPSRPPPQPDVRYAYFFRGDSRAPDTIIAHGGTKARTGVQTQVRELGMDQPWNPLADSKTREEAFFRWGKDDNCLVSTVSIARSIVDASKFPLLSTLKSRSDPGLVRDSGNSNKWTHTTVIYLVRVSEGFDTAGIQATEGGGQYGQGEYATRFIAPENHLAAFKVKRIFNGEEENDGHRCEIDLGESKALTDKLDMKYPTVRGQLPDHVLGFIASPPGDLPEYSTKSATEGKTADTKELSEELRKETVGKAAAESAKLALATKMKYAADRNVVVAKPDVVMLMDPRHEPATAVGQWKSVDELLEAMGKDEALVKQVQEFADIAQETAKRKALEEQAEAEKRLAVAAVTGPQLSPAEEEAKRLLQQLAASGAEVTLPKKRPAKVVITDRDDSVYKIGMAIQKKLDDLAKMVVKETGWMDALKAAAGVV
ncbi:MAG: hypothetical protein ACRDJW_22810 [Thermomicrobiales bacterium]